MARNISEVSIFGEYKQPENRLTAAFLQILKIGGEPVIREVAHRIGFSIPSSEIDIFTQVKEEGSVPDGQLECNFSFCLYIESKVGRFTDSSQLTNHLKLVHAERNHNLLYITGDDARPTDLAAECHWMNWETSLGVFRGYVTDTKVDNYELLAFLIDQYETLLTNIVYRRKQWTPDKEKVIVLAGSRAEGTAVAYGYYICQNHRQFQNAAYIAFFRDDRISLLFSIVGDPIDDADLRSIDDLKEFLSKERPDYDGEKQKVFKLSNKDEIGPIQNDSIDKNGNPCPYTYGQPRYTSLERIRKARVTSEL
jgi:hypothetical protein